jgi:hypothetical protein
MQRLRKRQRELNVSAADADLVMIGAGCTKAFWRYVDAERQAIELKQRARPALRFTAVGMTFSVLRGLRKAGGAQRCYEPEAALSFAHSPKDGVTNW